MAESGLQGIVQAPDYGQLLTAIPLANSQIAAQQSAQRLQEAQIPQIQAQTQGLDLANQRTQAQLAWAQQQPQPFGALVNNSGMATPPGTPSSRSAPTGDGSGLADWGLDNQHVLAAAQSKFAPPVPYTPQEQQQFMWAQQGARLGAPGAVEQLQGIESMRQARIQNQTQATQQEASKSYGVAHSVSDSDNPWLTLNRSNPEAAAKIDSVAVAQGKANGWDQDEVESRRDAFTRAYATEIGSAVHPFSNRGFTVGKDGVARDNQNNQPLLGGSPEGVSATTAAEQSTARRGQDLGQWTVEKDENGNLFNVNKATGQRQPVSGGAVRSAPQPSAPQPDTAGAAPPNRAGIYLPGVDPNSLPKIGEQSGPATKTSQIAAAGTQNEVLAQKKSTMEALGDDAKTRSLLTAAQGEIAKVNPRTVGPGSETYNAFQKFNAAVTGAAPDSLVNQQELDKFLNQVGAQNVRTMLSGQRITNQEMMTFMTRGSPNVEQSLSTIKNLVGYLSANNDFDTKLHATQLTALGKGADPFSPEYATLGSARSDYIQSRSGFSLPGRENATQAKPQASGADSGGFVPGKTYRDKSGNTSVYRGNGQWQ